MIKGLYRSASGMLPHVVKQEAVANNIANAGTTGFRKDLVFSRELSSAESRITPKRADWQQSLASHVQVDYSPGVFDKTDNPLDMAIEGDGFFVLQSAEGTTALTRSGSFVVDADGFLAFPGGLRVMGDGGTIQVGNGSVSVGLNGEVQVDGLSSGRIVPQSVADVATLIRIGGSVFAVPEGEALLPAISAKVQQGYLETSNVNVVEEMVEMIVSYRAYEANAKAVQMQDASLEQLMSRVAGR